MSDMTDCKWKIFPATAKYDKHRHSVVKCLCTTCNKTEKFVYISAIKAGKSNKCAKCSAAGRGRKRKKAGYKDIPNWFWVGVIYQAEDRKIEFKLTIKDGQNQFEKQNKKCAISGEPLTFSPTKKSRRTAGNASLDRIDSSKGYTVDNVQWVTKMAQNVKQTYSMKDVYNMATKIVAWLHPQYGNNTSIAS